MQCDGGWESHLCSQPAPWLSSLTWGPWASQPVCISVTLGVMTEPTVEGQHETMSAGMENDTATLETAWWLLKKLLYDAAILLWVYT